MQQTSGTFSGYPLSVIDLEEYKRLLGDQLKGLTEEELELWYRTHITFVEFVLKAWLRSKGREE